MSQYTTKEHIARATIEATCFQTRAILNAMEKDSGTTLNALSVDGGMSNSDVSMQIQADILGLEIDRPKMRETTALGAAIAAGFAVGVWRDFNELKGINRDDRATFWPNTNPESRDRIYANWEKAVERSKGWIDNDRADDDKE
jgi:glycerol kinase